MTICTKDKCVWRNETHKTKAYCFMQKCPFSHDTEQIEHKRVKWAGLIHKDLYYQKRKG